MPGFLSNRGMSPDRDVDPIGWIWQTGAGWPSFEAQASWQPWAFKTLRAVVGYFETAGLFWRAATLNNVEPSVAVVAFNAIDPIPSLLLYMSPAYASQYKYYLSSILNVPVPPDAGPIISVNSARKLGVDYVSIRSTPSSQAFVHPLPGLTALDQPLGSGGHGGRGRATLNSFNF